MQINYWIWALRKVSINSPLTGLGLSSKKKHHCQLPWLGCVFVMLISSLTFKCICPDDSDHTPVIRWFKKFNRQEDWLLVSVYQSGVGMQEGRQTN